MSTLNYIITGDAATSTHMDFGLAIRNLSLEGRDFKIKGSEGDNSFFLRPGGYSFEFVEDGGGSDRVYLTEARSKYSVSIDSDDGTVSIIRTENLDGSNVELERLIMSTSSQAKVIFKDGSVAASSLKEDGNEVLDGSLTSTLYPNIQTSGGQVRVAQIDAVDGTSVLGELAAQIVALGNGGVDNVYVTAGSRVDATRLGVGRDVIFLEGDWNDYSKTISGSIITLTREVTNLLSGDAQTETVMVTGGVGAANDSLLFANGQVDTLEVRKILNDQDLDVSWQEVVEAGYQVDETVTSFNSAYELTSTFSLENDSGVSDLDLVTNDGTVVVNGLQPGLKWEYSTDGGVTWSMSSEASSFELEGSGETGTEYSEGQVRVREINPFGVAKVFENESAIFVDKLNSDAGEVIVDSQDYAFAFSTGNNLTSSGHDNSLTIDSHLKFSDGDEVGYTLSFWMYENINVNRQANGDVMAAVYKTDSDFTNPVNNTGRVGQMNAFGAEGLNVYNSGTDAQVENAALSSGLAPSRLHWVHYSMSVKEVDADSGGTELLYSWTVNGNNVQLGEDNDDVYRSGDIPSLKNANSTEDVYLKISLGNNYNNANGVAAKFRDVKVFDKALTEEEVQSIMYDRPDTVGNNLVQYFALDRVATEYTNKLDVTNIDAYGVDLANVNNAGSVATITSGDSSGAGTVGFKAKGNQIETDADSASVVDLITLGKIYSGKDLVLSGTKEAGSAVSLAFEFDVDNVSLSNVTIEANGETNWSTVVTVPDGFLGEVTVTSTEMDAAGNASANSTTSVITVIGGIPEIPQLAKSDDSGVSDIDSITNVNTPTFSGQLPRQATDDTVVQLHVSRTDTGAKNEISVLVAEGDTHWVHTLDEMLEDGEYELAVEINGILSSNSTLIVDTTANAASLTEELPTVIEQSGFVGDDFFVSGSVDGLTNEIEVTILKDEKELTRKVTFDQSSSSDVSFTVSFTKNQIQEMFEEGSAVNIQIAVTDFAGNRSITSQNSNVEFVNTAPTSIAGEVVVGHAIGGAPSTILDASNVDGQGASLFSELDVAGSENGTLSYTLSSADGQAVPSWVELDQVTGDLVLAQGQTLPNSLTNVTLTIEATDGAGSSVEKDVQIVIGSTVELTSTISGKTDIDVRDEGFHISFNQESVVGTGLIRITNTQNGVEDGVGFAGESVDSSLVIDVTDDTLVTMDSDGLGMFVRFGELDLDLQNTYVITADRGIVSSLSESVSSDAITQSNGFSFTTIAPSVSGSIANTLNKETGLYEEGATWFDGSIGNATENEVGLTQNVEDVASVIVVGRDDGSISSTPELNSSSLTRIQGFGQDDSIYVDTVPYASKVFDENTISIVQRDNVNPVITELYFSGTNGQAIFSVEFADDPGTDLVESDKTAASFTNVDGFDSFESLTGNASPVIGG